MSCKKNSTKSECNCGVIVTQGFHSWADPGYWKVIKNDCTGNSTTFYFRTNQGKSIGDHICLSEETTW